jgi:hypothetical protein
MPCLGITVTVQRVGVPDLSSLKNKGLTAARMKRMKSIRKKLARLSTSLIQTQDIGGCRAILDSMDEVRAVVDLYRKSNGPHHIREDRSYIENPKDGGYRSHHLVFEFQGQDDEVVYNGRRIEVQLRTQLQHAWATAVEAVARTHAPPVPRATRLLARLLRRRAGWRYRGPSRRSGRCRSMGLAVRVLSAVAPWSAHRRYDRDVRPGPGRLRSRMESIPPEVHRGRL